MKTSDSLRVALISETLEALSPQRRRAALILLDLSSSEEISACGERRVDAIRRQAGSTVAAEVRWLLERLGVSTCDPPELPPH